MVLLAMFLIMGCVGAVSAEGDLTITSFDAAQESGSLSVTFNYVVENATSLTIKYFAGDSEHDVTEPESLYLYSTSGSYTATLYAKNETATISRTKTVTVTPVIVASFTTNVSSASPSLTVLFTSTSTSTGSSTTYKWTFGDGTTSTEENPIHTFAAAKSYDVVLNITDGTSYDECTNPITVTAPSYDIKSVNVLGINAPVAGVTLDTSSASLISDPAGRVETSTAVVWEYAANGTTVSGIAGYGTIYKANLTIDASEGYNFTSSTTFGVTGVASGSVSLPVFNSAYTQAVIICTYPATTAATQTISSVAIMVTAPQTGVSKSSTVSATSDPTNGIGTPTLSWSSSSTSFVENTNYTATVVVPRATGYEFTSSTTATINGYSGTISSQTSSSITVTYTFPKTAAKVLPTAVLSMNPASGTGTVPLTVKFSYSLSNFDNCTLTYGDGTLSTLNLSGNCTHTYSSIKSYTATLTAKNVNGTTTDTKTITVKKVGLVAGFQTKPTTLSGTAPFTVKFTDSSLGTITSRTWDFGDGTIDSTTVNPTHTYDAVGSGSYKVTLTIGDGTDTDFTTKTIYVTSPVTATTTSTSSVSSLGAITLENLIIPGPFDIIKEFLNLFYTLLNSDNYLFLNNTTNTTT